MNFTQNSLTQALWGGWEGGEQNHPLIRQNQDKAEPPGYDYEDKAEPPACLIRGADDTESKIRWWGLCVNPE